MGELVGRVPVLIAAQDVVGDVDVAGGHVVDALRDGHGARRRGRRRGGRNHGSGVAVDRADGGGTQGHGRWCSCSPDRCEVEKNLLVNEKCKNSLMWKTVEAHF